MPQRPTTPPLRQVKRHQHTLLRRDTEPAAAESAGALAAAASDFVASDSDSSDEALADVTLEFASPSRSTWQFLAQLANAHSGARCVLALQVLWGIPDRDKLVKLAQPAGNSPLQDCEGFYDHVVQHWPSNTRVTRLQQRACKRATTARAAASCRAAEAEEVSASGVQRPHIDC